MGMQAFQVGFGLGQIQTERIVAFVNYVDEVKKRNVFSIWITSESTLCLDANVTRPNMSDTGENTICDDATPE